MWIVDRNKERVRNIARNDVTGLINRLTQQSNATQQVMAELCFTAGGAPSGQGSIMAEDCQHATLQISQALQELYTCKACLDGLDIMVWVEDE